METQKKYDIFISYRKSDNLRQAQLIRTLLAMEYPNLDVSLDSHNLHGKWFPNLVERIDTCKKFVVLISENSLHYPFHDTIQESMYIELAQCSSDDIVAKVKELNKNNVSIDYFRLEIARMLSKKDVTIVPVLLAKGTELFTLDSLNLPQDLADLTDHQSVSFIDNKINTEEFDVIIPSIKRLLFPNVSVEPDPPEVKKVVNKESKIRMSETQKHLRLRKDESEEKWDVNKALALLPDYFKDDVFLFSKDYDNGGVKIIYNTDYRIKSLIEIPSSISFKDQVFKVTGISNEAFYGCNKLEVITIPNSVVCIEEYAFKNCKSLVSITLSKNITYIGKGAFSGCTSLKSIDVPNGVKRLDYDVFLECTSLREITLPASIEEVEYSAFQGCDSIQKVFIPSSMKKKYAHLLTRGMYKNVVCEQEPKNQKIKWIILCSIVLGISLLIIGVLAFSRKILQFEYDNTDMTATVMEKQPTFRVTGDVEIPSHVNRLGKVYTVTKIGDNAFKDAYSVAHVTIPSSISYIGSNAFSNCSSLTTIIIPNSVRDLSSCAFAKCIGLTSVTIGKNIQYISSFAFSECVSLDSIYYTGTIKQWERIIKGGFWVDKVPADVIHCVDGDVELRR